MTNTWPVAWGCGAVLLLSLAQGFPARAQTAQQGPEVEVLASLNAAFESGELKGQTYSNARLGFSIRVPNDWRVIPKSEIKRVLPEATERNAQTHQERGEKIRENAKYTAMLFMSAEKKPAREQLSLMIMAVPLDKEDWSLSGDALLHRLAQQARLENRSEHYFDEPKEKTYCGRKLWQSDLQRSQSGSAPFMRELVFMKSGLLLIVMGGAPDRASLDKLEKVYETLRFF